MDKSGRDYSGNMANAHGLKTERKKTDKRRRLGRSRGGLGTKIHATSNQDGLPLKFELTLGQAHDAPKCETLLTGLQPGQSVLADKAYDADWISKMIWEQGAIDVTPSKSNVEKHATESHKDRESAIKLDPPSFVVETPFHQATTERPAGLICVEKIGLARRRLPPTALRSRSGSELSVECGSPLHAN